MNSSKLLERTVYLDYLRVAGIFAVIILHLAAQNWACTDVNQFTWQVFNFFDSIVRWCVPIFVMISGALFLGREIPIKTLYSKYVLRMVTSFVVWSTVYAAAFPRKSLKDTLKVLIRGHFHMWFILMTIGLYICIPLIKSIAESQDRIKYYLFLAFIFAFAVPEISTLTGDFAGKQIIWGVSLIMKDIKKMKIHIVLGYSSYFILGYYLNNIELSKKQRSIIYLAGVIGFALTIGLDAVVALKTQKPCLNYYSEFSIPVLLESVCVFTWFKYRNFRATKRYPFIVRLSKYSFGAYLVHILVLRCLQNRLGLNTLSFHPVLAIVCLGILIFVISYVISGILNHIPVIRKYAV